ncbi:2-oxo-4-hydroxy-4-carboxy-5-ureidoimidazoline decarboxylase [Latimeria chalumnae]|uniref:2-oxo-4-hydroxy-4-carboxy-5-ureidoimidazoline decarboxylase n=2 Tax=Latimeria TaxID=7896 RepID=M3XI16_LATCH|nr:PREDICTED: putative 2-oxo-4-hydroxy-4-carboxy-5-ureidoimidazoline decarboxylase [Latimeria chalumnae]AGK27899.1 parahox neighbour [Latimeria menadoensis]CCT61358.1 parahox neighbor B [Latimeria menadoensis]|eukprot:XP_005993014.1 PREDICTED: putative 2-oxo-4-hydroxy-4-carboxy-5-ureidoimidazoline decarboxylase [Latimeria chalumnae]
MDIHTINSMKYEEFIDIFGNVVEKCPLITAAVWAKHPFASTIDLQNKIEEFIDSLPPSGKEGTLRCHPDLAGRDLLSGQLTLESKGEQCQAGLNLLIPKERERINQLNSLYKERFGFPFVICARMNNKGKILEELNTRIQNNSQQELHNGIEEVKKICHLRLQDIFDKANLTTKL